MYLKKYVICMFPRCLFNKLRYNINLCYIKILVYLLIMGDCCKLQVNPRDHLEPYITSLQSESKKARKVALESINEEIFQNIDNKECDLTTVFPEIYVYILKSFSDSSEACREEAVNIISNFIERLPLNDYYLTYILPVVVRRIGCPEIVEESEELRLILIKFVKKVINKYKVAEFLSPFMNDFTCILTKTCRDPYPKVKLEACDCIILLSNLVQRDFHFQSETYVKPVITNFAHQHFTVRVASIKAIGSIVMAGNAKCFELSITPMAEKLFDENANVRHQVTLEVGNWMLHLRDRYSFWHRMIPLLLTSLSDVMANIRNTASKLWEDVGLQYMDENEEDLKKQTDFLTDIPSHYPDVKRPNLGCRTLVQSNIGKIVPAIAREMNGTYEDARLRVTQLLCWLILCAEEGCTQHANTIAETLLRGSLDDDERVILEIKRASELFGYFISPTTWWPLLEPHVESWRGLLVITNVVKGSKAEEIRETVLVELCKGLADPERCQTRKLKYQENMMRAAEAIMDLCGEGCLPVAQQIFTINFTAFAMPADDKIQFMALSNLDKLRHIEDCGSCLSCLYDKHIRQTLASITSDALTWTLTTPDRCLLECILLHSGSAMGSQLHLIAPLLKECLTTPKVDAEVKLRMFTTLSTVLMKRQTNFAKCDPERLGAFLKILIEEIIMDNLVWEPGRTAEAIRTAAVACLCSALQKSGDDQPNVKFEENQSKDIVNLFPTKDSLEPFLDKMAPLLTALVDDNSVLTRQHSLRAICYLCNLAKEKDCFENELLHKLYFAVLKRLDDSNDKVRLFAVQTLRNLFQNRRLPYDVTVYGAHVDATYNAMLVHLDDADEGFRDEMLDALLKLSEVDPRLLQKKIKSNINLYRNKFAYEKLSSHIEKLQI